MSFSPRHWPDELGLYAGGASSYNDGPTSCCANCVFDSTVDLWDDTTVPLLGPAELLAV